MEDFRPMIPELLIEAHCKLGEITYHLQFRGRFILEDGPDTNMGFDFEEISVFEMKKDKMIPFQPKGYKFVGGELSPLDVMSEVLFNYMLKNPDADVQYMDPKLQKFIDGVTLEKVDVGDMSLPKQIIYGSCQDIYDLFFVTDKYIFYALDKDFLMFDYKSKTIIADNYFAKVGWINSTIAVQKGVQKMLFSAETIEDEK